MMTTKLRDKQFTRNELEEVREKVMAGEDFNLLLISYEEKNFKYGDVLKVEGNLEKPENFETDVGKEFDYKRYQRMDLLAVLKLI